MEIEPEMLAMETIVPVYFAVEDEALLSIYEQTQAASASQGSASAAEGGPGAAGAEWVRGELSLLRARSHCATSETLNTLPILNSAGYQALPRPAVSLGLLLTLPVECVRVSLQRSRGEEKTHFLLPGTGDAVVNWEQGCVAVGSRTAQLLKEV